MERVAQLTISRRGRVKRAGGGPSFRARVWIASKSLPACPRLARNTKAVRDEKKGLKSIENGPLRRGKS